MSNVLSDYKISSEFELDESYFGTKRVRGKNGRVAAGIVNTNFNYYI